MPAEANAGSGVMAGGAGPRHGSRLRRDAVIVIAVATATWTLANMDQSLFGYAVPDLMRAFGISVQAIGVMISLAFVVGIFSATLAGWATDLLGPRVTLPVCLGASALFVGLQGLATSALAFTLLRTAGYAFSAGLSPITNTMVANIAPPKRRRLMIALLQCGYPLGWFFASFVVAPLIAGGGWRTPFLVAFAVIPAALVFARLLPRDLGPSPVRSAAVQAPARLLWTAHRREALLATAIFFLYGGAVAGTVFYLPTLFQSVRGYGAATAARIVGFSYGIGMFGYIASAIISDRALGSRDTTIVWCVMAAVSFTVLVWLPHSQAQDIAAFGVAALFFYGTSSILTTYMLEIFPEAVRATAAGACASGGLCAGSVVCPSVVAALVPHIGWQWSLMVAVPLLLACALLLLLLPRHPAGAFSPA